jgi:hypothetical protein
MITQDEEAMWKLVYFIPIDLGSHGSTEFKGKELLKTMKKIQKDIPEIAQCYQGIIHSHHSMGAFHSGTDDTELEEGANRVGYPSLVVAHTGKSHAFKYSYEDQFAIIRLEEGEVKVESPVTAIDNRWKKEADAIEKENKSKPVVYTNNNQGSLWGGRRMTYGGYGYSGWGEDAEEEKKYKQAALEMENAEKLHSRGQMTDKKYKKIEKKWEKIENEYFGCV